MYEKRIDATSYERQRDKLREEIALVRIEVEDARIEEIDVEGLLGYAEHVLMNAAALWRQATPDERQRLQRAIFPTGLRFRNGAFGSAITCLAFMQIEADASTESGMASPTRRIGNGNAVSHGGTARRSDAGCIAAP